MTRLRRGLLTPLGSGVTPSLRLALLVVASAVLGACASPADGDPNDDRTGPVDGPPSGVAATAPPFPAPQTPSEPAPSTSSAPSPSPSSGDDGPVQIQIAVAGVELTATLRDTPAARDLLGQLPLTVSVRDHGGVEKTGPLPRALSLADAPDGADPEVGDLGYYAPSNDVVLYYGDQSAFPGIVILGHLHGDVAALERATGTLTVEIRRAAGGAGVTPAPG